MRGFGSLVLFALAWPLLGLGLVIAEAGTRAAVLLLVPAGLFLVAASLRIVRDREDVANHVNWGWSNVGHRRQGGVVIAMLLLTLGVGVFVYGSVAGAEALT